MFHKFRNSCRNCGAIIRTSNGGITAVSNVTTTQSPSFELLPNFPNPFKPVTTIGFKVAHEGFVRLKIFDLLGKEIETLVNGIKSPGTYEINWDGSSYAGVYF